MNDRKAIEQAGFATGDTHSVAEARRVALRQQLQAAMPGLVNAEGLLDTDVLSSVLGKEGYASSTQGYSLNFAGKGLARIKADEPTNQELRVELGQSKSFSDTGNVIIRGDNLDALKVLRQSYAGRVKMIYIDPPYNTDTANFIYKDSFRESEATLVEKYQIDDTAIDFMGDLFGTLSHSGWLYAMYPRLRLARELLTEDGVMFISIDDKEQANLKILCEEIFGAEETDVMVWRKAGLGRDGKMKNTSTYRKDHEYVIVCFKGVRTLHKSIEKPQWENGYGNPDGDPRGPYKAGSISRREDASDTGSANYYSVKSPSGKVFTRQFDVPEAEFKLLDEDKRIYWGKKGDAVPARKVFEGEDREVNTSSIFFREQSEFSSAMLEDNRVTTTSGSKELDDDLLLGNGGGVGQNFRSKPAELLRKLIQIGSDENSIVVDFFAGSGTFGKAAMLQNAKDGGSRKFILVQWDEQIDQAASKDGYQFCVNADIEPLVSSICIERVNRAGEQVKSDSGLSGDGLDIGYRVFSMAEKPSVDETRKGQLRLDTSRQSALDVLYSMMAASGEALLSDAVEEVEAERVYKVGESYFVLGKCETDLRALSDSRVYINGYAAFSLLDWLNALGLDKELVKILY